MNKGYFLLLLSVSCLFLTACGPSEQAMSELGRDGRIQTDAPVKASAKITIRAPVARVWALLTDVPQWPAWQHGVDKASLTGPLRNGSLFTWDTNGTTIHSRVVSFSPDKQLAWTGRASVAKAIHVLTLTALDSNVTQVESHESMDGLMLSWFYSSAELQASEDHLLQNLKMAAESSQSGDGGSK